MQIKQQTVWRGCWLAGFATLLISLFIFPLFPEDAAGDITGYALPIYAFEFASIPGDLIAVFEDVNDPDRSRRLEMMDHGNRWDFLFMTVYTAFGVLFGWAVTKAGSGWGRLIMIFAMIAGAADLVETKILLSITESLRGEIVEPAFLSTLFLPVYIKFLSLGASLLAAAVWMTKLSGKVWMVTGIIAGIAGLVVISATLLHELAAFLLGHAIGVGWILMLAVAIYFSLQRASKKSAPKL